MFTVFSIGVGREIERSHECPVDTHVLLAWPKCERIRAEQTTMVSPLSGRKSMTLNHNRGVYCSHNG